MTNDTPYGTEPSEMKVQRSSRDASTVPGLLADWLATLLPAGAEPSVVLHSGIDATGMSSETLIFDATWTEDGERVTHEYVARVTPAATDVPVFHIYDLTAQYEVLRRVGELSQVPVPVVSFAEPTGEVLGTPFFLMERLQGVVPPDVPPYNFGDNWLFDASPEQRRALEENSVAAIAALHAIPDAPTTFDFLVRPGAGSLLHRNLAWLNDWYTYAVEADDGVGRSSLTERALTWLAANVPSEDEQGEPVLSWGDARIGNMLYTDFAPAAVLDWEMASVGPRALDVSWLIFAHRVFESITQMFELPGMPDFLDEDDVKARYRELTGVDVGDLTWYHVYNAVHYCIVFLRTGARSIRFGEVERPEDTESLLHHRALVESMLDQVGA